MSALGWFRLTAAVLWGVDRHKKRQRIYKRVAPHLRKPMGPPPGAAKLAYINDQTTWCKTCGMYFNLAAFPVRSPCLLCLGHDVSPSGF